MVSALSKEMSDASTPTRSLSPVSREVIWRRMTAICDEMGTVLTAASYSPMIRDVRDWATGLADLKGRTIAANTGGPPTHFPELGTNVLDGLEVYGEKGFSPGDAVMINHTAVTGQHINNVQIYSPIILDDGRLVGFANSFAHWQDVGGITANRPTSGTTDCYQEGLQIRSVKIYRAGQPDEDMLRVISGNLRTPAISLGDMRAQIASCRVGVARFKALVEEWSLETILAAVEWVWDEAAQAAREAVAKIPDGVYRAESLLDYDGYTLGKTVPIKVEIRVEGSEMTMDFTNIADQAKGPLNSRSDAPANIAFKSLTTPYLPLTMGDFRPLKVICPDGKLIRANPGAPMGSWSWPYTTIVDTILKALEPALPDRVAAGNCGALYGSGFFLGVDERTGKSFMSLSLIPVGWGGRPNGDGMTAHGFTLVQIRDTPVEVTEVICPLVVEGYRLRQDSGGPGKFRGGVGVEYIVRCVYDTFVGFELDRTLCPPWGLHGGSQGVHGAQLVILPDGTEVVPPARVINYRVSAGSRVVVATGGGGGYGPPVERDPQHVLDDVIDEYVSAASAEKDYGVAIVAKGDDFFIDFEKTKSLRAKLK